MTHSASHPGITWWALLTESHTNTSRPIVRNSTLESALTIKLLLRALAAHQQNIQRSNCFEFNAAANPLVTASVSYRYQNTNHCGSSTATTYYVLQCIQRRTIDRDSRSPNYAGLRHRGRRSYHRQINSFIIVYDSYCTLWGSLDSGAARSKPYVSWIVPRWSSVCSVDRLQAFSFIRRLDWIGDSWADRRRMPTVTIVLYCIYDSSSSTVWYSGEW